MTRNAPSLFSKTRNKLSVYFKRANHCMAIKSQLVSQKLNEKFPDTMQRVRANMLAFVMYDRLANSYVMAPVSLLASIFSPIPGDGAAHLANAYRHSKKIYGDVCGRFNGERHRKIIDRDLTVIKLLNQKDADKTRVLEIL